MPEQGPSPRPRPRPVVPARTEPERRLTEALEETEAAARALHLPRITMNWEQPENGQKPAREQAELMVATQAHFAELEAAAAPPFPDRLTELAAPAEPDAWLVEGFIRPGTTVMLTGPPSSSKSWAARQLALSAGAGLHSFLDRYPVTRPLNVLVVDEDNGPHEEWRRDETLIAHLGLSRADLGKVQRLSLAGVQLDQPLWQTWLRGMVRIWGLDLLVLDPISEMHGGKELREDPGFRSLLGFLKRLKIDFPRLATLLVHHTRKVMPGDRGSNRGLDDVRGQWGQTPDVVALMWPLGERRVAWELHKRAPHSKLILEATEAGPVTFLGDETTARSQRMETDDKVLTAIEGGLSTAADIVTGTGLSKSGVFKAVSRLAEAGLITKRAPYQLLEGD